MVPQNRTKVFCLPSGLIIYPFSRAFTDFINLEPTDYSYTIFGHNTCTSFPAWDGELLIISTHPLVLTLGQEVHLIVIILPSPLGTRGAQAE